MRDIAPDERRRHRPKGPPPPKGVARRMGRSPCPGGPGDQPNP
ncbi:MAG: hypothetical protein QOH81_1592, partial [Sphingomonadales bacterium]|nr:hypothetical protein [Sphingomonadales bacterium]